MTCRPIFDIVLTILVVATFAMSVNLAAGEERVVSDSKVLLLRNGQVLSGQVSYEGDHYCVTVPHGEIRVRATEVEHLCHDLLDAYEVKRSEIVAGDVRAQLRLADWCAQKKLFVQAEELIAAAERHAPTEARVRIARRNLQLARNPDRAAPKVPTLEKSPTYSPTELDSMTRQMPDGTVETFRKVIQPMLLAGCAAARCHGTAATNDFRLIRPTRGHVLSRRATQRNLQAVLRWIEADHVGETPILASMTKAHAKVTQPVVSEDDSMRYQPLTEWVASVAESDQRKPPAQVGDRRAALSQALEPGAGGRFPRNERPSVPTSKIPSTESASPSFRDAWDPDIFNLRHHNSSDRLK